MNLLKTISSLFSGDLLKGAGDLVDRFVTTSGEKETLKLELKKLLNTHELALKEAANDELDILMQDVDSARDREASVKAEGKQDWMMMATGASGLCAFIILVLAIVFGWAEDSNLLHQLVGFVEGVALSIFGYYFGNARMKQNGNTQGNHTQYSNKPANPDQRSGATKT